MADLSDRRILVTGASSGIGRATAVALAEAGAAVAILARSADALDELAQAIGGVAVPADVADLDATRRAVDTAAQELGGLDGLANIAGLARFGSPTEGDPAEWRAMFDVNVMGLLHATHAATPHLRRASRGDIVNLSSMSGRRIASVGSTVYSATKHAVHAISEGTRRELAGDRIRVTTIAPGFVETPIFDHIEDDDERARMHRTLEEQGLSADDVARQIVHVLAQPPEVNLLEVAMVNLAQSS